MLFIYIGLCLSIMISIEDFKIIDKLMCMCFKVIRNYFFTKAFYFNIVINTVLVQNVNDGNLHKITQFLNK